MQKIVIAFLALLGCSVAQASEFSGVPRVVDGDTLAIGAFKVRLEGIDAPETDQVCLNAKGSRWTCGIDARDQLASHIAGRVITCVSNGTDVYHRILGTCSLAGDNLNDWMVQQGWALAYVKYSLAYVRAEDRSRQSARPVAGCFYRPLGLAASKQSDSYTGSIQRSARCAKTPAGPLRYRWCTFCRMHDQGKHQSNRRTHLSHAGSKILRESRHEQGQRQTVVLHAGGG